MPVGTVGPGGLELPQQLLDAPAGPGGAGDDDDDGDPACPNVQVMYDVGEEGGFENWKQSGTSLN